MMNMHAPRFGDSCIKQVSAYRSGGGDTEMQEDRRRQWAASDAG